MIQRAGLSFEKSQLKGERAKTIDAILALFLSIVLGYVLAKQALYSLPVNADSLAPFQEVQGLITNPRSHLFNIHVSRIPSLFPDLAILSVLLRLNPEAGLLDVFGDYLWVCMAGFVWLSAYLVMLVRSSDSFVFYEVIKIGFVLIIFLNTSFAFNVAFAHVGAPVHHGGSILNSLLLFVFTLLLLRSSGKAPYIAILLVLIAIATASNKLVIFTGILPCWVVLALFTRNSLRLKILTWSVLSTLLGVIVGGLLNDQCATAEFNIYGTFSAFSQYMKLSWMPWASIAFSIMCLLGVYKARLGGRWLVAGKSYPGLIVLSLSTLSCFIYLPMLTSSGEAPHRYILIPFILLPIFLCSLYWFRIQAIVLDVKVVNINISGSSGKSFLIALFLLVMVSFGMTSFDYGPIVGSSIGQNLQEIMDVREPFAQESASFINQKGYQSYIGLSDYWGAGATLQTNSKLNLIAMWPTGRPNFWAATPHEIIDQVEENVGSNFYLMSKDSDFLARFVSRNGDASEEWFFSESESKFKNVGVDSEPRILIYRDPNLKKKILMRSSGWQRQCNPDEPNYAIS